MEIVRELKSLNIGSLLVCEPNLSEKFAEFSLCSPEAVLEQADILQNLRKMRVTLAVGRDDPFLSQNIELHEMLLSKAVSSELYLWDGRAHQGGAWRRMAPLYVPSSAMRSD